MKNATEFIAEDGTATGIYIIDESTEENVNEVENVETEVMTSDELERILNSKTLNENLDSGLKIMGIGMAAVFAVLTILYLVIKIMGHFARSEKDKGEK